MDGLSVRRDESNDGEPYDAKVSRTVRGDGMGKRARGNPVTRLVPIQRTGRFLVDVAARHRARKLALFGIELDLDLYRAALVNMRTFALGLPYFILRADALLVDASINSPNWRFANLWDPPGWETHMAVIGD